MKMGTNTTIADEESYTLRVFEPHLAQQVAPVKQNAVALLRSRFSRATRAARSTGRTGSVEDFSESTF